MKKIISFILAVVMVASVVAMLPVFTVSAADAPEHIDSNSLEVMEIIGTKKQLVVDVTNNPPTATVNSAKAVNLFDGRASNFSMTKYEGNVSGSTTVAFQTVEPGTAAYYAVYTGNDSASYTGRNPDSWTLYGSVNGVDYYEIDKVTNTGLENKNGYAYVYEIDTPKEYQYYKFELNKNGYLQLNELILLADAPADTLDTTPGSITEGRYELSMSWFGGGSGNAFIDSQLILATHQVSRIFGTTDSQEIMSQTSVYVNGAEAKFNKGYLGYTHCGRTGGYDGYTYGIVSAGYTAGEEATVTILIGDKYYVTGKFTPEVTSHQIVSSEVIYSENSKTLTSTVTFAENLGLEVGDRITFQIHDENVDCSALVVAVKGNTVTYVANDFTTTHSLVKGRLDDGSVFSMPIDHKPVTDTAVGYVQTRENANDPENKFDTRIIVEGFENYVTCFKSATMDITFTLADNTTKTFSSEMSKAYNAIQAGSEVYTASGKCALFGVQITGVPFGVKNVSAVISFDKGLATEEILDLGSTNLTLTKEANVDTVKAMNKYDANSITVTGCTASDKSHVTASGEGSYYLFDGTTSKFGSNAKPGFEVSFETAEAITISGLIFTIANDTNSSGSGRTYQAWTIYGIDANGDRVIVATSNHPVTIGVSNISGGVDPDTIDNANREAYLVVGADSFSKYVISITAGTAYTQMGEITLYTAQ